MSRITGSVTRRGLPVRVYVRLLDRNGEFVGEVLTGKDGGFAFYAAPGDWFVRVIGDVGASDVPVTLAGRNAAPLRIAL